MYARLWQVNERAEVRTKTHRRPRWSDGANGTGSKLNKYDECLSLPLLIGKAYLAFWGRWSVTKDVKIIEMCFKCVYCAVCVCVCVFTDCEKKRGLSNANLFIPLKSTSPGNVSAVCMIHLQSRWRKRANRRDESGSKNTVAPSVSGKCLQTCFWATDMIASLFWGWNTWRWARLALGCHSAERCGDEQMPGDLISTAGAC